MWNDLPDFEKCFTPADTLDNKNQPQAKFKIGDYVTISKDLANHAFFGKHAGKSYWVVGLSVIEEGCVEYALSEIPFLLWENQLCAAT